MKHLNPSRVILSMTVAATAILTALPALATSGSGFAPAPIVTGHYGSLDVKADKVEKWDLFLKTKADSDVGADRLTVQPGGYSGWHSHPAPVFITVTEGEIQWYDGGNPLCTWQTYHAGQSFIEQAFRIHQIRNATGNVAEFIGIRISPAGVGFRIDANKPTNCQ
nr:cupin domain-containing protein [Sphingomonas sp. CDS-1]